MINFLDAVLVSPNINNTYTSPEPTATPFILLAVGFIAILGLTVFFIKNSKRFQNKNIKDGESK